MDYVIMWIRRLISYARKKLRGDVTKAVHIDEEARPMEIDIRYHAKKAVMDKLKQIRYVFFKRLKRYQGKVIERGGLDQEFDCYPMNIDLGCFLALCRSVFQYVFEEIKDIPEKKKLYDNYVRQREIFKLFKDLRDSDIHVASGQHRVEMKMNVVLPMHVRTQQELDDWQAERATSSPREPEIVYHIAKVLIPDASLYAKMKDENRDDIVRAIEKGEYLYAVPELDGENDLFVLCEKYLNEIEQFVSYCSEEGIIS